MDSEQADAEEEEIKEADYHRLDRRLIYLYRLAGDDVLNPKSKKLETMPFRVVIRFVLYAIVATFVITERSQVGILSEMNAAIKTALEQQAYDDQGHSFYDIQGSQDTFQWLNSVVTEIRSAGSPTLPLSNPLSILAYNRVMPRLGVCINTASVTVTMRRVSTTTSSDLTTTSRFNQLYPVAWVVNTIEPGQAADPGKESMDPIYLVDPADNTSAIWKYTPPCDSNGCPSDRTGGYKDAGGFIAVITVAAGSKEGYIHFVHPDGELDTNSSEGVCRAGLGRTDSMLLSEFAEQTASILDVQLGSMAVELQVYNANYQTLSRVVATFTCSANGIITSQTIRADSILLDISHSYVRYFEITYLLGTCCYFFELVYKIWQGFPSYFKDGWCYVNGCSIIASFASLALWYSYMPKIQNFIIADGFYDPQNFDEYHNSLYSYTLASSFAVFTIYLRMLQFLASTRSRVVLLLRTIFNSASNMCIYVLYILIIFIGFATFGLTHFGTNSIFWIDFFSSFVSSFTLFLGQTSVVTDVTGPLKVPFIFLFTFFFFFLSVQMFNAIINYSYNRASEAMEAVFEREKLEKQRKEMLRHSQVHESIWQRLSVALHLVKAKRKGQNGAEEDVENGEAAAPSAKAGGGDKGDEEAAKVLENEDPQVKEKVEEYLARDRNKTAKDGLCTIFLYAILVGCYIWFLYVNMLVEFKSDLQISLNRAITSLSVTVPDINGGTSLLSWSKLSTLQDVTYWLQLGLMPLIFNSSLQNNVNSAQQAGILLGGVTCINNFNCLLTGSSSGGGTKILRLTQRRSQRYPNTGARTPDTPDDQRFTGSVVNGTPNSLQMVPYSGFFEALDLDSYAQSGAEDTKSNFTLGDDFCSTVASWRNGGSKTASYNGGGGIVCSFDSDPEMFQVQADLLRDSTFFSPASVSFAVEFVTQNAHRGTFTYMNIHLELTPAGRVQQSLTISSVALFGLDFAVDNLSYVVLRLAPGIIYMALVFFFLGMLYGELQREHTARKTTKKSSFFQSVVNFFIFDIFRVFDALSAVFSIASAALFITWLVKESSLGALLSGDFDDILEFSRELTMLERSYNRLSAFNLLLMFVRPLRFMRENARMKRLNQTLYDASADIQWFIVVLFSIMFACVILTHVCFGATFSQCSNLPDAFNYCFFYIVGVFDFWQLYTADPFMSVIFFFPYLLLFYCSFTNIFFAILDRFFINEEPPPLNFKRKLKPIFSRICRCIEWDDDFVMEEDPNAEKKGGPQSRASRVQETAKIIQAIELHGTDLDVVKSVHKNTLLSEVCDPNERMSQVIRWSRDEAKALVDEFQRLLLKKQEAKNYEVFIKTSVLPKIEDKVDTSKREMEEAFRQMRYATEVHEVMAIRDQHTLARYIHLLEAKIHRRMLEKHSLLMEVHHLRGESDSMRFTKEDLKHEHAVSLGGNTSSAAAVDLADDEQSTQEDEAEEVGFDGKETTGEESFVRDPNDASDYVPTSISKIGATKTMLESLSKLR